MAKGCEYCDSCHKCALNWDCDWALIAQKKFQDFIKRKKEEEAANGTDW